MIDAILGTPSPFILLWTPRWLLCLNKKHSCYGVHQLIIPSNTSMQLPLDKSWTLHDDMMTKFIWRRSFWGCRKMGTPNSNRMSSFIVIMFTVPICHTAINCGLSPKFWTHIFCWSTYVLVFPHVFLDIPRAFSEIFLEDLGTSLRSSAHWMNGLAMIWSRCLGWRNAKNGGNFCHIWMFPIILITFPVTFPWNQQGEFVPPMGFVSHHASSHRQIKIWAFPELPHVANFTPEVSSHYVKRILILILWYSSFYELSTQ